MFDEIIHKKKKIPAPGHYNHESKILDTIQFNNLWTKSPRQTEFEMLSKKHKKTPGVGQYETMKKERINNGLLPRSDRITETDVAGTISKEKPSFYPVKYNVVEKVPRQYKFPKMLIKKPAEEGGEEDIKAKRGPSSYDTLDAYKRTQISPGKFFISKS